MRQDCNLEGFAEQANDRDSRLTGSADWFMTLEIVPQQQLLQDMHS